MTAPDLVLHSGGRTWDYYQSRSGTTRVRLWKITLWGLGICVSACLFKGSLAKAELLSSQRGARKDRNTSLGRIEKLKLGKYPKNRAPEGDRIPQSWDDSPGISVPISNSQTYHPVHLCLVKLCTTASRRMRKVCVPRDNGRHPHTYKFLKRLRSVTRIRFQVKTASRERV